MNYRLERTLERRRMDRECDAAYLREQDWVSEAVYGIGLVRHELAVGGPPTNLYVVRDGDAVKIGLAVKPAERRAQLQIGNPRPLLLYVTAPSTLALERHLHALLKDYSISGEWFSTSDRVLAVCSLIASMGEQCDDMVAADGEPTGPADALYALTWIFDHLLAEGAHA